MKKQVGPKIEKGVPMPRLLRPERQVWLAVLEKMQYGDSVRVHKKASATGLIMAARRRGAKVAMRTMFDSKGRAYWRIWKVRE